jgi:flavin-dependent dehydrogenase
MTTKSDRYDVVIMGGGLAGLALARQLLLSRPSTSVLVVERLAHPVPEAAHKVGEATVEISAHYFAEVLGLRDHLDREQLRKMGLRFFPAAQTPPPPLSQRAETGPSDFLPRMTYQLDRGRFENALAEIVIKDGVEFISGHRVEGFTLGAARAPHRVRIKSTDDEVGKKLEAAWLIDASGRRGLIKNQLGLAEESPHDCNAVWMRLGDPISMDDLIDYEQPAPTAEAAAAWRARVPSGERWRSTNHLMGRGYWAWLIPLASGSTSVGVVADPRHVDFDDLRTLDSLLGWLAVHEPELARAVEERRESLQDFRMLKHYAHGCKQVFSPDRWALTGEAGVFTDPLYSPGGDFIALSNTLVTHLVNRDLEGEPIEDLAAVSDAFYLIVFRSTMAVWQDQYGLMGNPQVWSAKCVWDIYSYMSASALLYNNGGLTDTAFMTSVQDSFATFTVLNHRMQNFFREWDAAAAPVDRPVFVDVASGPVPEFAAALAEPLSADELRVRLAENVAFAADVARVMMAGAARLLGHEVDPARISPQTFSFEDPTGGGTEPVSEVEPDAIERAEALLATLWHQPLVSVGSP